MSRMPLTYDIPCVAQTFGRHHRVLPETQRDQEGVPQRGQDDDLPDIRHEHLVHLEKVELPRAGRLDEEFGRLLQ